ncbi:MAG: sulfur carrier protein ThiS [Limnohabitans sp.]|nr:sulfur carrier protein ThiS [Limnohabitans sp.]
MKTNSITVTINGALLHLKADATLNDAIEAIGIKPPFAAAVNLQFVPRQNHDQHRLSDNDTVELISPITGG